jgi:hypothetical protein
MSDWGVKARRPAFFLWRLLPLRGGLRGFSFKTSARSSEDQSLKRLGLISSGALILPFAIQVCKVCREIFARAATSSVV